MGFDRWSSRRSVALGLYALWLLVRTQVPAQCGEFRGVWVDSWGTGFRTPQETAQMVDLMAGHGFSAIFVQVRSRGDAYYNSSIEPRGSKVPDGYDPLADILARAHKQGVQVHAWVMLYDAWNQSRFVQLSSSHVCAKHPDWLTQDVDGRQTYVNGRMYLDPGLPEVRDYLELVVSDIVRRYAIDGIHLDGLRYPDSSFGYNPRAVSLFNMEYKREGKPAPDDRQWADWRRAQVTGLAQYLARSVHRIRPSAKVSLAAYWNQTEARDRFFQDWPTWARAGYFDFIVPMVFVPKDVPSLVTMVDGELACAPGATIYIGQGAWRYPAATTNRHIRVIRGRGVGGFVLFDYTALSTRRKDGTCLADDLQLRDQGR